MTPPVLPVSVDPILWIQWLSGVVIAGFIWLFRRDEKLKSHSIDHKIESVEMRAQLNSIEKKLDKLLENSK